jgi:hypothetical protein
MTLPKHRLLPERIAALRHEHPLPPIRPDADANPGNRDTAIAPPGEARDAPPKAPAPEPSRPRRPLLADAVEAASDALNMTLCVLGTTLLLSTALTPPAKPAAPHAPRMAPHHTPSHPSR